MENIHFKHLFWFCVGVFVVSFVAMMALIFLEYPKEHAEQAANTQGFLQGSLIMSAVGFLLTGNIKTSPPKPPLSTGTTMTDINISATTTTEPKPKEDDKI